MKKYFLKIALAIFLFSGCATSPALKGNENTKIYRQDLTAEGSREIIKIDDNFDTDSASTVTIMSRNAKKICDFSVPGRVRSVEFLDLYDYGIYQIALFYEDDNNYQNLEIRRLNNIDTEILAVFRGNCGIKVDSSTIPKIKVCRYKCSNCGADSGTTWDVWSWSGEKFVREN
ncbi:MAG: hypothetical protein NC914_01715 [Candidatus Omnitrophica bacterium]|nr:hypothetical protein [Candidatus Omnitrophota bacterium]